ADQGVPGASRRTRALDVFLKASCRSPQEGPAVVRCLGSHGHTRAQQPRPSITYLVKKFTMTRPHAERPIRECRGTQRCENRGSDDSRIYRSAAVIAGTPSVFADASATSNSSRGYTPSTSVATTATASARFSAGLDLGSDPSVSVFTYMKTTMRM